MWKSVIKLMSSNIVYVFLGVIINFMLPKYLSTDTYAMQKEFLFYLSYASLISFGYIDGMFIEYGGKRINAAAGKELASKTFFFELVQLVAAILIIGIGAAIGNRIIVVCSVGIFFVNILNYYKNLCVAVGEYDLFSLNVCFEKSASCVMFCILIFILRSDNYVWYCMVYIAVWIICCVFFKTKYKHRLGVPYCAYPCLRDGVRLIKLGIPFMFGNLSYSLLSGIDRWFVKIYMETYQFAMYSFAISLEQIINAFLTPIGNVLYNGICRDDNEEKIREYKKMIYVWSFLVITAAFAAKFIIKGFLPNYLDSVNIMFVLFASQIINIVISAIYINIYRSNKNSKEMIFEVLSMLAIGGVLNYFGFLICPGILSFAVATLVVRYIWLAVCIFKRKSTFAGGRTTVYVVILTIAFLRAGCMEGALTGMGVYLLVYAVATVTLMWKTVLPAVKLIKRQIKVIKRGK